MNLYTFYDLYVLYVTIYLLFYSNIQTKLWTKAYLTVSKAISSFILQILQGNHLNITYLNKNMQFLLKR